MAARAYMIFVFWPRHKFKASDALLFELKFLYRMFKKKNEYQRRKDIHKFY